MTVCFKLLAEELGLVNLGEIATFPGHFLLQQIPKDGNKHLPPTDRAGGDGGGGSGGGGGGGGDGGGHSVGQPDHQLTFLLAQDPRQDLKQTLLIIIVTIHSLSLCFHKIFVIHEFRGLSSDYDYNFFFLNFMTFMDCGGQL